MSLSELAQAWFQPIASLLSVCALAAAYYVNTRIDKRVDAAKDELNDRVNKMVMSLAETVKGQGDRITKLEAHWETLPTREDFHKMALQFSDMGGGLKAISQRIDGIDNQLKPLASRIERIDDYLLSERRT